MKHAFLAFIVSFVFTAGVMAQDTPDPAPTNPPAPVAEETKVQTPEEKKAADEKERLQRALRNLESTTSSFDLSKLSVGNEHRLEIGGGTNQEHNILARIINVLARLFGTVAVMVMVIGAFFMITSQGDENQLQKGKTIVLYTVLGLLIGFTAYMMVQFVINILFQT